MSFFSRFIFACLSFFKILSDAHLAKKMKLMLDAGSPIKIEPEPILPRSGADHSTTQEPNLAKLTDAISAGDTVLATVKPNEIDSAKPIDAVSRNLGGVQMLSLLQREGRLIDFISQDIHTFSDEEVGMVARTLHEGMRRAISGLGVIKPLFDGEEGKRIELDQSQFEELKVKVKWVGDLDKVLVSSQKKVSGTLIHRGWWAETFELPMLLHSPTSKTDKHSSHDADLRARDSGDPHGSQLLQDAFSLPDGGYIFARAEMEP